MLETKEQKQTFFGAIVLVVILSLVSFWNRPDLTYKDSPSQGLQNSRISAEAYAKYLASLNVDQQASKDLFEKIISQQDIQKQVEEDLGVGKPVVVPQVDSTNWKISSQTGQEAVVNYLKDTVTASFNFESKASGLNENLFAENQESANTLLREYQGFVYQLEQTQVPKETVNLHKSLMTTYAAYGNVLQANKDYAKDPNLSPWATVYNNYAVVNDSLKTYNQELTKLSDKYKLASLPAFTIYAEVEKPADNFQIIPTAQALFGLGDVTITVGDIPAEIRRAVEEGLTASFSQFMGNFLQKVITKIQSNYSISNFLYYTDALIGGEYTDDYLRKYVASEFDRQIVKKFIPQLTCYKQNEDLRPLFQAKADQYLGFDPATISVNDPDYTNKLVKVGNFLSSPSGWESYYQGLAAQTQSEAEKAAERELISPGIKNARDTIKNAISVSVNDIVSAQRANLNALMQLGISNAKSFISRVVSQLTENLVNNFVFKGAVPAGGTLGVLKEQATCLAAAQVQVIVPVASTIYIEPPPAPNQEELLNRECASLPRGCTTTNPNAE